MPPMRVAYTLWMLLVGWPLYLLINASGRPYKRWDLNPLNMKNHTSPLI